MKRHPKGRKTTRLVAEKLWEIQKFLTTLSDEQVAHMNQDVNALSEMNCWHVEFEQRDTLLSLLASVRAERERDRTYWATKMGVDP